MNKKVLSIVALLGVFAVQHAPAATFKITNQSGKSIQVRPHWGDRCVGYTSLAAGQSTEMYNSGFSVPSSITVLEMASTSNSKDGMICYKGFNITNFQGISAVSINGEITIFANGGFSYKFGGWISEVNGRGDALTGNFSLSE